MSPLVISIAVLALIALIFLLPKKKTDKTLPPPESPKEALLEEGKKGLPKVAGDLAAEKVLEVKPSQKPAPEAPKADSSEEEAERAERARLAQEAEERNRQLKEEERRLKEEARLEQARIAKERAEEKKRDQELARQRREEKDKKKEKAAVPKKEPVSVKKVAEPLLKLDIPELQDSPDEAPERSLKDGLGKTRKEGFIAKLGGLFSKKQSGDELMDEVEEALFTADIGVRTADKLTEALREGLSKKDMEDPKKIWGILRQTGEDIFNALPEEKPLEKAPGEPHVVMVLGVNGAGKTTSIGKLAHRFVGEGKNVKLIAGDTFRAAAAEQLVHWGKRVNAECIRGEEGADPASVVFDGVKASLEQEADLVFVDTAGRLHNNVNLMDELKKVRRVMGRAIQGAPHEVLLVLDATTGQNAVVQAKQFKEATQVTGIILTKLDGTARGGVVLGIADELKIPIRWVGVGERVNDLKPFDAKEFIDELFSPPEDL